MTHLRTIQASLGSPFFFAVSLCLGVLLFGAPSTAQQKRSIHQKAGYDVTWGGKRIAKMTLTTTCKDQNSERTIQLDAKSLGLVDHLRSFDVQFVSKFHDPKHGFVRSMSKIVENGELRNFVSKRSNKGVQTTRLFKGKTKKTKFSSSAPLHSVVSWLIPLKGSSLKPGTKETYLSWDGWKMTKIDATVLKPGPVFVPKDDQAKTAIRVRIDRTVVDHHDPKIVKRKKAKVGVIYLDPKDRSFIGMDYRATLADAKIRMTHLARKVCKD